MGTQSKENRLLELFLNEPSKHWHFSEIVKQAKVSKDVANKWLKKFKKDKLIVHIKPRGKMPYFKSNFPHPNYLNTKKIYALNQLHTSGFLGHLQQLPKVKTVIIFGSFARGDWHTKSDIDLFIYGDAEGLDTVKYWRKLHRKIEDHHFTTREEIREVKSGLLKNILRGYVVKGDINQLIEAAA